MITTTHANIMVLSFTIIALIYFVVTTIVNVKYKI